MAGLGTWFGSLCIICMHKFCIASVTMFNVQFNVGLFLGRLWIEVGRIVTGKHNVARVLLISLVWLGTLCQIFG